MSTEEVELLCLEEIKRSHAVIAELNGHLNNGRTFLMTVDPKKLKVEDALEAFGFGRDGKKTL